MFPRMYSPYYFSWQTHFSNIYNQGNSCVIFFSPPLINNNKRLTYKFMKVCNNMNVSKCMSLGEL